MKERIRSRRCKERKNGGAADKYSDQKLGFPFAPRYFLRIRDGKVGRRGDGGILIDGEILGRARVRRRIPRGLRLQIIEREEAISFSFDEWSEAGEQALRV